MKATECDKCGHKGSPKGPKYNEKKDALDFSCGRCEYVVASEEPRVKKKTRKFLG